MTKPVAPMAAKLADVPARRRSLYWRIHFWAALIASPFTLVAALTGILYIFTPQVEARLYRHLDHVVPSAAMLPLDASLAAAQRAAPPGLVVQSMFPAYANNDAVRVVLVAAQGQAHEHHGSPAPAAAASQAQAPGSGALTVFVNPHDSQVLGMQTEQERFSTWARNLHSRLLQGDGWRWMIELAASWLMVMLLTGIYLWWPRAGQAALPQRGKQGRAGWRQWHAFAGVALSVLSLTIVVTGLTWSKYAGDNVRTLRDISGQTPPKVPRDLHSMPVAGAPSLTWEGAALRARELAPDVAMQLTPPKGPHGVWLASAADKAPPGKRFDLVLDAYTGEPKYYSGWDKQTAFGQATAVGIPFHRGELGLWNQALLLIFGVGVLFSLISGWVMFFKRRRAGLLGLPKLLPGAWRTVSPGTAVLGAALCALMPLLAISAAAVLVLELLFAQHAARRSREGGNPC
jgi:uncharacterized iron-regulated membrane protein